jgi:hypothetical protein
MRIVASYLVQAKRSLPNQLSACLLSGPALYVSAKGSKYFEYNYSDSQADR